MRNLSNFIFLQTEIISFLELFISHKTILYNLDYREFSLNPNFNRFQIKLKIKSRFLNSIFIKFKYVY